eukprot:GFUD01022187.1.p1 GENE.GFUD01022187.1~~GFUD01022187.1.p1  ORF type:complete len:176 (+),score=37.68 GFUD01022187.1:71-598(+)
MPHLRPLHGVPSLSPAKRLVLLKGRGKGPAIKDIELEGESDSENEGKGGNWKRRMISDSEDEFVPKVARDKRRMISDSEDEFVPKVARDNTEGQLVSRKKKVKARITPKRQAKLTPYKQGESHSEDKTCAEFATVRVQPSTSSAEETNFWDNISWSHRHTSWSHRHTSWSHRHTS